MALNFGAVETIGTLFLNGTQEPAGTYNAAELAALDSQINFSGNGSLFVTAGPVPEPGTLAYVGVALVGLATARHLRRRAARA